MCESFDVPLDYEDGFLAKSGEEGSELRKSGHNSQVAYANRKFGVVDHGYPEDRTRHDVYTCANAPQSAESGD